MESVQQSLDLPDWIHLANPIMLFLKIGIRISITTDYTGAIIYTVLCCIRITFGLTGPRRLINHTRGHTACIIWSIPQPSNFYLKINRVTLIIGDRSIFTTLLFVAFKIIRIAIATIFFFWITSLFYICLSALTRTKRQYLVLVIVVRRPFHPCQIAAIIQPHTRRPRNIILP